MTIARNAVCLSDDAADLAQWREANRGWLRPGSRIYACAAEGGPLKDADGHALTASDQQAMAGGFLLTRPDWRVAAAFGERAAAGGFMLAMGRVMSRKIGPGDRPVVDDVAPGLLVEDIEQFAISATYDGFLCRRLPLECLWVGAAAAEEVLTLLSAEDPAVEIISALTVRRRLSGDGGRLAYLSDMKALWRRDSDVRNSFSFQARP